MTATSPQRSATFWLIGPVLLGLAIGLQLMFWAWGTWLVKPVDPVFVAKLTQLGKFYNLPDYDERIYFGGMLGCLLLMGLFHWRWSELLQKASSSGVTTLIPRMNALLGVAGGVMALRLALLPEASLSLVAALSGLLYFALATRAAGKDIEAQRGAAEEPDREGPQKGRTFDIPVTGLGSAAQQGQSFGVRSVCFEALAVVGLLALCVYIPDPDGLASTAFGSDRFHHLDFYAMAPAIAFEHGLALGTDFYSQYGVGWPMVLAGLSHLVPPLGYPLLLSLGVAWGCIYYAALYLFLRLFLRTRHGAMAGLILALGLQLFSGTSGEPMWVWPQSTVMRYAMDIFFFLACLQHIRRGGAWRGLACGGAVGCALLLGTDTGVYLSACLAFYCLVAWRLQHDARHRGEALRFAFLALVSAAFTSLGGLALASGGSLWRPEFWPGWIESLLVYGSGFSHLPIENAVYDDALTYLFLSTVLALYFFTSARMLLGVWRRRVSPEHLLLGIVALYGMETLLLFIGRSHPYNLFHTSIPFCIVVSGLVAEWLQSESSRPPNESSRLGRGLHWARQHPSAGVGAALCVLMLLPNLHTYPNLLMNAMNGRWGPSEPFESGAFFNQKGNGNLPIKYRMSHSKFKEISNAVRDLSDGGRQSVALIDGTDPLLLLESGLPPYFRYSPVIPNLVFTSQVESIIKRLDDDPPDHVVICTTAPSFFNVPATDSYDRLWQAVKERYTFEKEIAGMAMFRHAGREAPALAH